MATDGVSLFYNPAFVDTLNAAELAGFLAHEVMHPALQHHTRRADRDVKRWNMACDYAINPLLLEAGLTLPKDVLIDHRFRGMSAERIYNLIEEQHDQDGSNGEGKNQDGSSSAGEGGKEAGNPNAGGEPIAPTTPGGVGQVLDAPEPEGDDGDTVAEQAREWKIAVEQAENVAKLAGKLPAGITRSLKESKAAGVDWRELLHRAWSETIPSDYSWMPPNRRRLGWSLSAYCQVGRRGGNRHRRRLLRVDQCAPAGSLRGRNPLHTRGSTTEPGACALLRYRSPQGRGLSGWAADLTYPGWGRRNELRALLSVVGRARNCAADPSFSDSLMWHIPRRRSCLPSIVGLHGVTPSAIRAGDSNGGGLAPRFHLLRSSISLGTERWSVRARFAGFSAHMESTLG
jgi:hypothetical protein